MIHKVQQHHRQKSAYVYIRQSTVAQVRHHQESTERQYALEHKAVEFGWPPSMIRLLDRDLGQSGAQSAGREDFKLLVAEVSMGSVGAIFALEASRLARSNADWQRLLELCSLTNTLIIDEDGCYDLSDFNDRLLLGLKGTMSEAELHFLRLRLLGGKLNKAKKGELRFPLPVGFAYDPGGRSVFDPDQQVQSAVQLLFDTFRQTGSAFSVVNHFARHSLRFPKRAYGGAWDGRLIWARLSHSRVLSVLKNPSYAGTYVFGRFRYQKYISPQGEVRHKTITVPMSSWTVTIHNHHQGYITWDEFLQNQIMLERNRTHIEQFAAKGPPREGLALLQGLLLCAKCGRRLRVSYRTGGSYECNWVRREGLANRSCLYIRSYVVDEAISRRALEVIEPATLEIALAALDELEHREQATTRQWQLRIERAQYEADLAQRRYQEVDPSNRLVAATLERDWNQALEELDQLRKSFTDYSNTKLLRVAPQQRDQILSLAQDLPRLWSAPTTSAKDRKRVLRLLIKDVTIQKLPQESRLLLQIRWQGGACESLTVDLPPPVWKKIRHPDHTIERVRELAATSSDEQIAASLNREGIVSPKGKPFSASIIKWIRYRYGIPLPSPKRDNELSVQQVVDRFRVSRHVVYYWIERKIVDVRRINRGSPFWITITPEKELELVNWVQNSSRIHKRAPADS
jgi:DNA invertase Pin-like site-specific DNA recombinase